MNEQLQRILNDSADQSKTCWASDSGQAVSECWCAQCAEGRFWYPVALETQQTLERKDNIIASYIDLKNKAQKYIQDSIDRGDWESSELEEPFWEELAEIMDLNLKRTKEVWVSITVKYSGSIEVPYDFDESDLEAEDVPSCLDITHNGESLEVQNVTFDEQEIDVE